MPSTPDHPFVCRMLVVLLLLTLGLGGVNSTMTSQNCSNVVDMVLESAYSGVGWAVEMVDSCAKPQVGILRQEFHLPILWVNGPTDASRFLGNYDQCLGVETTKDFGTSYCTADLQIKKIGGMSKSPPSHVLTDICVPDICSGKDLVPVLQHYINRIPHVEVVITDVTCQEKHIPWTYKAILAIIVLSVLLLIIAAGTIYDLVYMQDILAVFKADDTITSSPTNETGSRDNGTTVKGSHTELDARTEPGVTGQVLMSFSLYKNISNLLSTNQSKGSIPCVNGIRVLSSIWIIWGHLYNGGELMMENVNTHWKSSFSRWSFQPVLFFTLSVDTFFVLSGLLSAYKTMRELRTEKPTLQYFKRFYFHRYWRLTPPLLLWMLTYVSLFKYISDGPFWPQGEVELNDCEDGWWKNILYINTFNGLENVCMVWNWSLTLDMHFFIVSPIVIMALYYMDWYGLFIPIGMTTASALYSGILTYKYQLPPTIIDMSSLFDYINIYYINPICRCGPYLVGMMTGYILYRTNSKVKLSKSAVFTGWVMSIVGFVGVFAVLYNYDHYSEDRLSAGVTALHNATNRNVWAISLAWVIFACSCGYGGIVNKILSWKAFVPLTCVCYLTYQIHVVVIRYYFSSQRRQFYLNDINVNFACVACVVVSLFVSSIAYLLFEAPFSNLERVLLNTRQGNQTKVHQN